DYHSLVVLELARAFPRHGVPLRDLLAARRSGLSLNTMADVLWDADGQRQAKDLGQAHGFSATLMTATLWIALKPLYEAVAQAFAAHFDVPQGGASCPVCGAEPWARCGGKLRCPVCESVWTAELAGDWRDAAGPQARGARRVREATSGARLIELEESLFNEAFSVAPLVQFLLIMESDRVSADHSI